MRRCILRLMPAALLAMPLAAQSPPASSPGPPAGARVVGLVYDSLAGAPLAGATVQLVRATGVRDVVRSTTSDEGGAFRLAEVPPGRYTLGFLHPVLDSLGLDVPARDLQVADGQEMRVGLAVPSAARVRVALCGGSLRAPPALQLGVVRRATDLAPVAGAIVEGGWTEYTIGRGRLGGRLARVADTTGADGRYLLCDVPRGGTAVIRVAGGTEQSALIDVDGPTNGVSRRDVYVGSGRTVALPSDAGEPAADSVRIEIEVGDGRLGGRVLSLEGARPVAGARVGIVGGREVRSGEDGAWVLGGIPTGTRLLEVRAVGFASKRVPVDVHAAAPSVDVRLATIGALLDTVRVTASRHRLQGTGFEQRARRGAGHYLTTRDMLRRGVIFTSHVFHTMPGLRVDPRPMGETRITMRGAFGRCSPAVYIDGVHWRDISADEIDSFVSPDEVAGIEVYTATTLPPEFNPGMTGCGSIVIWRKMGENPARHWSARRRALQGGAVMLIGVGLGALLTRM